MTHLRFQHEFVDVIPDELKARTIYVCIRYCTVVHLCACGCGREVVTPLSPTDWELTFDGEHVSLSPSIGNWSYPCQSHYWITRDIVRWAGSWTVSEIEAGRRQDQIAKAEQHGAAEPLTAPVRWWRRALRALRQSAH